MNGYNLNGIVNFMVDEITARLQNQAAAAAAPPPPQNTWAVTTIFKNSVSFIVDNPKKVLLTYGVLRALTSASTHEAGSHTLSGVNHLSGAWDNSAAAVNSLTRSVLPIANIIQKTSENIGEMHLEHVLPYVVIGTATLFGTLYVIKNIIAAANFTKNVEKIQTTASSKESSSAIDMVINKALSLVKEVSKALEADKNTENDQNIHKQLDETMLRLLQTLTPLSKATQEEIMKKFKTHSAEEKLQLIMHLLTQNR